MLDMNLKQLEAFAAVVEHNSFTRAAEEMYLTQSTISAHIRGLEECLGCRLFDREAKKKISLTEEGKLAYTYTKDVLARCRRLKEVMEKSNRTAELAVGASTVAAIYLLPGMLSEFLKRSGDCRCVLKRGDSARVLSLLRGGEIQVGFVGIEPESDEFEVCPVLRDRMVIITENSPYFRAMKERGAKAAELMREPVIFREEGSGSRVVADRCLERMGISVSSLNKIAEMDNPENVKNYVANGMGVSVISAYAADDFLREGKILAFDLEDGGTFRNIYMVYEKDMNPSLLEKEFIDFVHSQIRGLNA
ncbi:MAG: LysR family transcriptional regulator [Oscillospiraceae bacterium]|nr:LysR family transcriptional regulator [Oscillospiraceae bacterium]